MRWIICLDGEQKNEMKKDNCFDEKQNDDMKWVICLDRKQKNEMR